MILKLKVLLGIAALIFLNSSCMKIMDPQNSIPQKPTLSWVDTTYSSIADSLYEIKIFCPDADNDRVCLQFSTSGIDSSAWTSFYPSNKELSFYLYMKEAIKDVKVRSRDEMNTISDFSNTITLTPFNPEFGKFEFVHLYNDNLNSSLRSITNIYMIDNKNGIITESGSGGKIFRTNDGGQSWIDITYLHTTPTKIYFKNQNEGWILGYHYTLEYTKNSGSTWNYKQLKERDSGGWYCRLKSMTFSNSNTAWIVGERAKVFKSLDGGENWEIIDLDFIDDSWLLPTFYDVKFIDPMNGWIVGDDYVIRTSDGGNSWEKVTNFPYPGEYIDYYKIHFHDSQNGFISAKKSYPDEYFLFKTDDAGNSWTKFELEYLPWKFNFMDKNIGWGISGRSLARTKDGGITWNILPFHDFYFYCITFHNKTGFVGCDNGKILKIHDISDNLNYALNNSNVSNREENSIKIYDNNLNLILSISN